MYQRYARFNWVVNVRQVENMICLFSSRYYLLWVYQSSSESAYVVTDINHEWTAYHNGLNDLNHSHNPNLASNLSSILVLIFWFFPVPSLLLKYTAFRHWIRFYLLLSSVLLLTNNTHQLLVFPARNSCPDIKSEYRTSKCQWRWDV